MKYPYIFIGNIPRRAKRKDVENLLKRFGRMIDFQLKGKENGPNFVVARYATIRASQTALDADLELELENTALHIEEKRSKLDYFPWLELTEQIDFDQLARDYAFRNVVMEDHLVEFILSLATYYGIKEEAYQTLIDRLTSLCHIKPKDLHDLCPPHLSGMIFNKSKKDSNGRNILVEFKCIILAAENITLRRDNTVKYNIPTMSREEAEKNLRLNLVKGLFLYFFAKFAHGPKFEMKPRFYGASEPLKTTLQVITGHNDTSVALRSYFKLMTPYFTMDYKKEELRLKNDLFRPKLRAKSTIASDVEISDQPSKELINDHHGCNAPYPSDDRSSKKLYSEILCKNSEQPRMVKIQNQEQVVEDQRATSTISIEPLDVNNNIDDFDVFDDSDDEEYPVVRSVINQVLQEKKCATCLIKVEEHNTHNLYDCVDELMEKLAKKDARIRELEMQNMELKSKLEKYLGNLV